MTGTVITAPIRFGVLGAARIADLAIIRPARVTGHRLVAVAARDRRRAEAVCNPLANSWHGPWNLAAIQAGASR